MKYATKFGDVEGTPAEIAELIKDLEGTKRVNLTVGIDRSEHLSEPEPQPVFRQKRKYSRAGRLSKDTKLGRVVDFILRHKRKRYTLSTILRRCKIPLAGQNYGELKPKLSRHPQIVVTESVGGRTYYGTRHSVKTVTNSRGTVRREPVKIDSSVNKLDYSKRDYSKCSKRLKFIHSRIPSLISNYGWGYEQAFRHASGEYNANKPRKQGFAEQIVAEKTFPAFESVPEQTQSFLAPMLRNVIAGRGMLSYAMDGRILLLEGQKEWEEFVSEILTKQREIFEYFGTKGKLVAERQDGHTSVRFKG